MTRIEYDLLREQHPGLNLIPWISMGQSWRNSILQWDREEFVTNAVAHQLTHDAPYFGTSAMIRRCATFAHDA